jgi:hypothetical protein
MNRKRKENKDRKLNGRVPSGTIITSCGRRIESHKLEIIRSPQTNVSHLRTFHRHQSHLSSLFLVIFSHSPNSLLISSIIPYMRAHRKDTVKLVVVRVLIARSLQPTKRPKTWSSFSNFRSFSLFFAIKEKIAKSSRIKRREHVEKKDLIEFKSLRMLLLKLPNAI